MTSVGKTQLRFGELFDFRLADASAVIETVQQFPEVIRGIKLRVGATCAAEHGLTALEMACELGKSLAIPVAVHATAPPPSLKEVLSRLRKGDIFTHCYAGNPLSKIITGEGNIKSEVLKARERGVLFDLGHGAGSFSFEVAEQAIIQGFLPDTISSDLHAYSINGPVFDLPTTISKLVLLGIPFEEAVYRSTYVPACFLNMQQTIGSIEIGKKADFAVAVWSSETFPLCDSTGACRQGKKLLVEKTILEGNSLQGIEDDRVEGKWKPGLLKEFKGKHERSR
jgi:dihydroorotase